MSEIVRVGLKRGALAQASDVVAQYPDLRIARDKELQKAGCCGRAAILRKYEALAQARQSRRAKG